jgi:hypothetical protein
MASPFDSVKLTSRNCDCDEIIHVTHTITSESYWMSSLEATEAEFPIILISRQADIWFFAYAALDGLVAILEAPTTGTIKGEAARVGFESFD